MADKDFKVKSGIDITIPLSTSMGGTGQTTLNNALNAMLPTQSGQNGKILETDGTNLIWDTLYNGFSTGNSSSRPASPVNGQLYSNTETGFMEVYNGTSWISVGIAPSTPTSIAAINQGTNRPFNNGQASISFTPGVRVGSTYTVTSNPGGITATGSSSPIILTGLQSGTGYAYSVTATSPYGISSPLSSSLFDLVVARTVPQAPTIGTATAGNAQATVSFTANSNGAATITSYTVTSSPGNITASGASSPITVTGLTNGTAYTFTVTATNENGNSLPSAASNSVTPSLPVQGGYIGNSDVSNVVEKLAFTNDTISVMSGMSMFSTILVSIANSGVTGYVYGSNTSISKTPFSTETTQFLSSGIRHNACASISNSGTAGYGAGGDSIVNEFLYTKISKMPYSSEAASYSGSTLSSERISPGGFANVGIAGYIFGGSEGGGSRSNISKISFSNDSISNLGATLSASGFEFGGHGPSNSGTAGYIGSRRQNPGSGSNAIDKISYSSDTRSTLSATMSVTRFNYASFAKSGTAGYFAGGNNSGTGIDKLTFSNDSITTLGTTMSTSRSTMNSYANSGII